MDVILIPGPWLGAWSWYAVAPILEAAGHTLHRLTLPGLESPDADRSSVTVDDHIRAVVAAIDAAGGPVVLVAHAESGALATAAADARVDRVARIIHVSGVPSVQGEPLLAGVPADGGADVPFPDWTEFGEAAVRDLGDAGMSQVSEYVVPSPRGALTGVLRLSDWRRFGIPVTIIATDRSVDDLRAALDAGEPRLRELAAIRDVGYVDLPTGRWPQLTRPEQLAEALLATPELGGALVREPISNKAFHEHPGVEDWRVLFWGAYAFYRATFAEGARLTARIAEIAAELEHEPDVDVRSNGVTIRTFTRKGGELSTTDAELARRISEAARDLGLEPDPSQVQAVGIAIAEGPGVDTRPFWAAAFGYEYLGAEDAIDRHRRGPHLWFHPLDPPKVGRGRVHIDVSVPADQLEARVQAALVAGGRIAHSNAPKWYTLASPDNHGVDLAGWPDFDEG